MAAVYLPLLPLSNSPRRARILKRIVVAESEGGSRANQAMHGIDRRGAAANCVQSIPFSILISIYRRRTVANATNELY